jgi:hypothetical protein
MGSNPLPTKKIAGKKGNTRLIIYTILNQINFASKTKKTIKQNTKKKNPIKKIIKNTKQNIMKNLIKVLEREGNKKSSRKSNNSIKMLV